MKVDTGRFSIEIPDAFRDVTAYVFEESPIDPEKGAPPDRVSVSFEPLPERVPPEEMAAVVRDNLQRASGGSAVISEGSIAGYAAPATTLRVEIAGAKQVLFKAFFRCPGALMGKVVYESSRTDASAVFEQMISSIRFVGVRAPEPESMVRRRAGSLWIVMPDSHGPLSSYSFEVDGGRARLFLDNEPVPPGQEPDFEGFIDKALSDSLEVEPLNEGACPIDRRPIEERSWQVDRISEEADVLGSVWFRVAFISLEDGSAARAWMVERTSPDTGNTYWPLLIDSIQPAAVQP